MTDDVIVACAYIEARAACLRYLTDGMSFWNPSGSSNSSGSGVGDGATFLSLAKETNYGSVLEERMLFSIYLHRGGMSGSFHDCIVVRTVKYGCVTLELSKDEIRRRIIPKCVQFQGEITDLKLKQKVECTFKELADEAMEILRSMGDYQLFGNNCQNFCNYFLKAMEAPQYKTTARTAAEGAAAGTGVASGIAVVGAVVLGLLAVFAGKR